MLLYNRGIVDMNAKELQEFEKGIADLFKAGKIRCPVHLSSGNEDILIEIFAGIAKDDYIFSTHRNHLHYLLHTGQWDMLTKQILVNNDSMHTCDPKHNFYSSSIVAGCVAIACGVAYALKLKKSKQRVWCFIGDGATDEGWFWEALKYAESQDLSITYVIEDNDRSVVATKKQRWGPLEDKVNNKIKIYHYKCAYPHVGIGQWVNLEGK